jgi:hyperosmotically inducible protein
MRLIRSILMLAILIVLALFAYNYMTGNGWTLHPSSATGFDADTARRQGVQAATDTARKAGQVATQVEEAVSEGALTTKIKSKMVLDDSIQARTINVATTGTIVTLTGTVRSAAERERAVRLARETNGVTQVVDKLEIRN